MMELSALPTGLRASRLVRKVDKPRPLKLPLNQNRLSNIEGKYGAFEEIMAMTEAVSGNIANGNHDSMLQHSIMTLCSHLKKYGPQLETVFKDQLDRAFLSFRNGSRDEHLDVASRLHLLEVIELRTRNWSSCEDTNNYYKQHIVEELLPLTDMATLLSMSPTMLGPMASPTTPQPPLLSPGEIIKTSGKFGKPTKIPGKNYCKDEVVIRNSDSGKVMGIKGRRVHMIEELSETIISFQRVLPGAKERLVQITGPSEGRINDAKLLIEDTIRRNASPVRVETAPEKEGMGGSSSSLNSSASDESNRFTQAGSRRSVLHHSFSTNDASIGEYKYTVTVGHDTLKITGTNLELVKEAKLLLDDYYSGERGGIYGSPDNFLTSYEEEPRTPSAVTPAAPKLTAGSRLSSLDSGATSESDETYKAPPSTCTVSSPPRTQVAASQGQTSSKLDTPAVVRYERDELLDLCTQAIVHGNYREYDRLVKHFPDMMPKCQKMFDPQSYVAKWKEMGAMASVVLSSSDSPDVE